MFATDLHDALARRGHDLVTVALAEGTTDRRIDVPALGASRLSLGTLRRLRERMGGVDITVAHGSTTLPACALARTATSTPFVYRQISDSRFWAATTTRRLRVRLFLRAARLIVALSEFSAGELIDYLRVDPGRIRIVPNGVSTDHWSPTAPDVRAAARRDLGLATDRPTVAFVGALVAEKGADLAVDAALGLPEVQLVLAGDGPERGALEERVASAGTDHVRVLGSVDDPALVYAAADVVVLPSRGGDTMPAVLIEAGLCGLPTIATPVGAIEEIVVDGETGLVVPRGDLDALRGAISSLIGDRGSERASAMGVAARRRCVERFDIEHVAASWERVLEEASGTAGRGESAS